MFPASGAFDASTPADAQTKPCRVCAITSGGRLRTTSHALAQDHLEVARVAVRAGELARALRGLDVGEAHDAALDLRDRLLRDDDDVAVLEPSGPQRRLVQLAREIVALVAARGSPRAAPRVTARAAQGMPVRRTPACAL